MSWVYFWMDYHFEDCKYGRHKAACFAYLEVFVVICTLQTDLGRANLCYKISLVWDAMSGEREILLQHCHCVTFSLSSHKIFSQLKVCRAGRAKNLPSTVPGLRLLAASFKCIQLLQEIWAPRRSGVVHQCDAKMGLMWGGGMQHVGAMLCPFGWLAFWQRWSILQIWWRQWKVGILPMIVDEGSRCNWW